VIPMPGAWSISPPTGNAYAVAARIGAEALRREDLEAPLGLSAREARKC
jgi:hypothetical protein